MEIEPRAAVDEALFGRLDDRGARAAAADPALFNHPVGPDERFRAGLRRGDGDGAHDGRKRKSLAFGLPLGGAFEHALMNAHA